MHVASLASPAPPWEDLPPTYLDYTTRKRGWFQGFISEDGTEGDAVHQHGSELVGLVSDDNQDHIGNDQDEEGDDCRQHFPGVEGGGDHTDEEGKTDEHGLVDVGGCFAAAAGGWGRKLLERDDWRIWEGDGLV